MTVEKGARDRAQSIVGLATVAVVAYSAFLALVNLFRLAVYPGDPAAPAPLLVAALATAVYLPLQLWLVLAVVRDRHRRAQRWAAADLG